MSFLPSLVDVIMPVLTQQQIHILGAGLSGLILSRNLQSKNIPFILFEKAQKPARNNYGITLQPWAYQPLLKILNIEELAFRKLVSVGSIRSVTEQKSAIRAHRGRVEELLREGLDIRWNSPLQDVSVQDTGSGILLDFKDRPSITSTLTVDTLGIHSQLRKSLLPASQPTVLPIVCFRGTRLVSVQDLKKHYGAAFETSTVIEMEREDVLLQISINDYQTTGHGVDISYIYSRPAHPNDPLHRPGRDNSSAKDIPEEFFTEVSKISGLQNPFRQTFEVESMRQDRILHWLMRSSLLPLEELERLAEIGIVVLGDATHAMPILGGEGANCAIRDAVELAEFISINGVVNMKPFYRSVYKKWQSETEEYMRRLEDASQRSSL